ncbi:MAG TPA: DUF3515 family protein, partial [Spirochaetia bacterium]
MKTDIVIPSVGESVTQGILATWLKKDGDSVAEGSDLLELETDKATVTIPAPASGVLAIAVAARLVGGCASAVPVDPATHATDPDCASLILATPDRLGDGLDRRRTTAQATTAWGDPAIVLRCGIEPPGPTTDRCETVTTPDGPSVDWLVVQDDQDAWTFTTYGRVPAVEVLVPAAVAA